MFHLLHYSGREVAHFKTYEEVIEFFYKNRAIRANFGTDFRGKSYSELMARFYPEIRERNYDYIVRDDAGYHLDADKIKDRVSDKLYDYFFSRRRNYKFRNGPVPNTRSRWRGRYYRRIKTFQERKQTEGHLLDEECQDYGVRIRYRRRPNTLPEPWDDISRNREKNWKRQRKTQWK